MQKVTLLCVGSLKFPWVRQGCEEFIGRLRHAFTLDVMEVSASKQTDPAKQQAEESTRLLAALEKREGEVWVLDERGKAMTSVEFSVAIGKARDAGLSIIFVLGGAYGLTDAVRTRADRILTLSDMTFPHELCRLVFLEQLYRASEILKGSGYHH
ncbi:MAG: 23S rRNA (pseudouridine(1915)-N(3))-methyltransferase RlmH [Candidatus Peribacteraceae bacterium]|nr:23S rRNA (pseudouridine(1915)-N(3))-methyltransferase RlmH [Candidatus Peribacteraceae bacterium]MDD5742286.1 23S rRNA (pseudouridine(1915)-N(3))-methyltransferase RlmH [Candidatus Peribacteraceae bacterium]